MKRLMVIFMLAVTAAPALAQHPDNGMTFGEHRCHLVALALSGGRFDLDAIAAVFRAHGVDPATPHRTALGPS